MKYDLSSLTPVLTLVFLLYVNSEKTKQLFKPLFKYAPLLIAVLIPVVGFLMFYLAPHAFRNVIITNGSFFKACCAYFSFIVFTFLSFPLCKLMYEEYRDNLNRLS